MQADAQWLELEPLRALLALERVWLDATLGARGQSAKLWFAPDAAAAQDLGRDRAVAAYVQNRSWRGPFCSALDALPVADASVSLLVLQHVLEDLAECGQVLRECERVLSADGELIVLALNPTSPWHGWMRMRSRAPKRWRLAGRLRASLMSLGLKVSPPLGIGPLFPGGNMHAATGTGALRMMRAAYALRARKYEVQVIPLRRAHSRRLPAQGQLVPTPSPFSSAALGRASSGAHDPRNGGRPETLLSQIARIRMAGVG